MSDIVLAITPPFNLNYLPIGMAVVKSLLNDKYDVKCFDLRLDLKEKVFSFNYDLFNAEISEDWYNEKTKIILDENPKVVGFTIYRSSLDITLELTKYIKSANPSVKIVLAGPEFIYGFDPNLGPQKDTENKDLFKYSDYIYQGEAETGALEFFTSIMENTPMKTLGVWLKDRKEVFHYTGHRERLMDLDKIPMPDYSDFERDILAGYYTSLPVEFSRGCSYRCTFCDAVFDMPGRSLMIYQKFRTGQRMFEEVYKLFNAYKLEEFIFVDDSFVCSRGSKKELMNFCDLLMEHKMNIRWRVYGVRITKFLDEEDIDKMVKSGMVEIRIGLESGSPAVRKDMGKEPSTEITDTYINSFLKYNIKKFRDPKTGYPTGMHSSHGGHPIQVNFFMMYNYPSENAQNFQETLDWILRDGERGGIIGFTPFNPNLPYVSSRAEQHNFKYGEYHYQLWTSDNSNFMIRFSRFIRLLDIFKNNKTFWFDLPDIGFTKNYIRINDYENPYDIETEIIETLNRYLDKKIITPGIYKKYKKLKLNDWLNYEK
jgi:radical SAM superfamily enzyme YgiQ (UPF0313 family)